jgi:hypothetical protein
VRYTPTPTPSDARQLRTWISDELRRVAVAIDAAALVTLAPLATEPARLANGMVVYANGSTFNPGGAGEGVYARVAGAWVKLHL